MLSRKKDFINIDDFQHFPVLVVLWWIFNKIDGFGFDFHKTSLSGVVEAS